MKLKDLLNKIDRLKPDAVDQQDKIDWINTLEGKVHEEILSRATDYSGEFVPYTEADDSELSIPAPYDDIYFYYICAQIDYLNNEIVSYNNNISLFNSKWDDFAAFYRRNHVPKSWRG